MARIINSHKFKLRTPPPQNMENWSKRSFIVIPNCLPMCYPPGLTCGLHTFVYHFGSIPVELTYLGIENPGWKRDGEVKKNVYGKIHDHIFIHTKVCIYMHLLYFVYCIYILCNMYLSNIFEIFFDAILYALKSLWKSPVHDMGKNWNCLVTQLNSKGFGFKAWNWRQTDTEHLGF